MATTPNFNLPLYTGSDTAKLDTLLNGQSSALDTNLQAYIGGTESGYVGTDSQRTALSGSKLRNGVTFYATDTRRQWRYINNAWQPWGGEAWIPYTPTWSAAGGSTTVGNGSLAGRFQFCGAKTLAFRINLTFGSSTSGATGVWYFTLPSGVTSHPSGEQAVTAKAYLSSNARTYGGFGQIYANSTAVYPNFPYGSTSTEMFPAQNADSSGAAGTGVPRVSGAYSFGNGSNLTIEGTIEVA